MPTDSGQATYLEAVGLALDHEMERDPDTFLIGEDVGQYGGAFKVTKPPSPKRVSPVWRPAPRWWGCGRSSSTSSRTSSPARSTRSSTCWPGTIGAPVTPCR